MCSGREFQVWAAATGKARLPTVASLTGGTPDGSKYQFAAVLADCWWQSWTQHHTHTHAFNGPFPGLPGWAGTREVKPIWFLLKQETVSGSGISRAICKSAPCSRQITTPAPHHSVFYRPDALPAAQPTASKHWRVKLSITPIFPELWHLLSVHQLFHETADHSWMKYSVEVTAKLRTL